MNSITLQIAMIFQSLRRIAAVPGPVSGPVLREMTNRPVGFACSEQLVRAARYRSATLTQLIGVVLLVASSVAVASTVRSGIGRQEGGATARRCDARMSCARSSAID
jgi:hypothetical protein